MLLNWATSRGMRIRLRKTWLARATWSSVLQMATGSCRKRKIWLSLSLSPLSLSCRSLMRRKALIFECSSSPVMPLVMKSSAPISSPRIRSAVSVSELIIRIGIPLVSWWRRRMRLTSKPCIPGISLSRRIRSGRVSRARRAPLAPSWAVTTW